MMFGQLAKSESLRDLIVAIEAHWKKSYHLGMGKSVTRSNLAKANEQRDYRIFEQYAYHLVAEAGSKSTEKIFGFDGRVYAFDSTTIDLCLAVFGWAKFRKHKGGIKVHTLYDIESQVPAFFHISPASTNDVKAMPEIPYETGAYYIFDRSYNDFANLFNIEQIEATFVVRAKRNLQFKIKKFRGTSENAVRVQIYCAIITYCLVVIIKHDMQLDRSAYEILQMTGISLTDKTHLRDLFDKSNFNNFKELFQIFSGH